MRLMCEKHGQFLAAADGAEGEVKARVTMSGYLKSVSVVVEEA